MGLLKRILIIVAVLILISIWGLWMIIGWLITGKNCVEDTWVDRKLDEILDSKK